MKIYLSAGHNVRDEKGNGSKYGPYDEGAMAAELRNMIAANVKGVFVDEDTMPLSQVINDVNKKVGKVGLAIELHFNSVSDKNANGTEAVIANSASVISRNYAKKLAELTSKILETHNRGVKTEKQSGRSRLGFVRDTQCSAVILEICFLSNDYDMGQYCIKKQELAKKLAEYLKTL